MDEKKQVVFHFQKIEVPESEFKQDTNICFIIILKFIMSEYKATHGESQYLLGLQVGNYMTDSNISPSTTKHQGVQIPRQGLILDQQVSYVVTNI